MGAAGLGDFGRIQGSRLCSGSDAGRKWRQGYDAGGMNGVNIVGGEEAASALNQEEDVWSFCGLDGVHVVWC